VAQYELNGGFMCKFLVFFSRVYISFSFRGEYLSGYGMGVVYFHCACVQTYDKVSL